MQDLVDRLAAAYSDLQFVAGESFYWCPETSEVFYDPAKSGEQSAPWSLLHETCHALLGHTSYTSDLELLHLEVAAWSEAIVLGPKYGVRIDDEYVQDCLDTYRDWLYRRSVCPGCGTQCLQDDDSTHYRCFNCHTRWHVSPSRFCRAYRRAQTRAATPVFALKYIR